ncbi:MAG: tRNA/rRNA methyltransferase [Candidatus Nanohaloarchaea archaeon]|jgi:tRNA/rRNA methyltransferase
MTKAVVLIEPQIPENTGFIARLCSNYEYELRLVNPEFNLSECRDTAVNAQKVLEDATIFESLDKGIEDLDFVVGTKPGRGTSVDEFQPRENTSIVFGREDSGLSNEELEKCDAVIHLNVPGYSSLNLSHAAGIMMYSFTFREEGKNLDSGQIGFLKKLVGDNLISDLILRGSPTKEEFERVVGEIKKLKNS